MKKYLIITLLIAAPSALFSMPALLTRIKYFFKASPLVMTRVLNPQPGPTLYDPSFDQCWEARGLRWFDEMIQMTKGWKAAPLDTESDIRCFENPNHINGIIASSKDTLQTFLDAFARTLNAEAQNGSQKVQLYKVPFSENLRNLTRLDKQLFSSVSEYLHGHNAPPCVLIFDLDEWAGSWNKPDGTENVDLMTTFMIFLMDAYRNGRQRPSQKGIYILLTTTRMQDVPEDFYMLLHGERQILFRDIG